ncbi:MAG: transporter [Frankiales bacterium]|nr:transporter [Frankiales bacterium]
MVNVSQSERGLARSSETSLFAALMIGMTAQGMAITAPIAGLPQMAKAFGPRGDLIAALTIGVAAAGLMIGSLISGWVLERLGTRGCMLWMLAVYGFAGFAGFFPLDPLALLISRFVVGFATACLVTACVWGIAYQYDDLRRATILGWASSFSNVSAITGTLIGGLLSDAGGWRSAFLLYPLLAVAAFCVAAVGIRQLTPVADEGPAVGFRAYRVLLPAYAAAIILFVLLFMGSVQLSFALSEAGFSNSLMRSIILSLVTVWGAIAALSYGRVAGRFGRERTSAIALASVTCALLVVGLHEVLSAPAAIAAASAFGIFAGLIVPGMYDDLSERSTPSMRSRAIGLLTAAAFLGGFLNGPIFKLLGEFLALRTQFLCAAAVALALAIHAAWMSRRSAASGR